MTDDTEAPSKLRLWREAKGWTQGEVAGLTGLAVQTVSQLERGETRLAPATKVEFARRLRAKVSDLFDVEPLPEAVG